MTRSKKEPLPIEYVRKNRRRYLFVTLIVVFSSCAVWGISLFLSHLGPKRVDPSALQNARNLNGGTDSFKEMYQKMSARELKELSIELEVEAQKLKQAGDYKAAATKYDEAFELQKSVDQNYPSSPESNPGRAGHLKLKAENAAAEPLFLNSLTLERRAGSFAEAGQLDAAKEALDQAIEVQQQLNKEYRDVRQASTLRLKQLKGKLTELKSQELSTKIEDVIKRAVSLEEAGEMKGSGELFEEAVRLQKQLNEDFPDSSHASLARVREFQERAQTAQSTLLAQEMLEKSALLEQLLAMRKTDEAELLIVELKQEFQVFKEAFPLSALIDEISGARLEYLYQRKADLATIQDQVYDALLPVPGVTNARMLRTEVPQSLYALLMGTNPSRNPSGTNPVDSVSWVEAEKFCERLSWILGKAVRLPAEKEYRKALGILDSSSDASALIWSISEANGLSQPVGRKKPFPGGYFDLLGNVSEWLALEEPEESETAFHIGGHVQDSLEMIISVPVRSLRRTERSRLTGFRIVVIDPAPAKRGGRLNIEH